MKTSNLLQFGLISLTCLFCHVAYAVHNPLLLDAPISSHGVISEPSDLTVDSFELRLWWEQEMAKMIGHPNKLRRIEYFEKINQIPFQGQGSLEAVADILFEYAQAYFKFSPAQQQAMDTLYASRLDFVTDQLLTVLLKVRSNQQLDFTYKTYKDKAMLLRSDHRAPLSESNEDFGRHVRRQLVDLGLHPKHKENFMNWMSILLAWRHEPIRLLQHDTTKDLNLNFSEFLELNVLAHFAKKAGFDFMQMSIGELKLLSQMMHTKHQPIYDLLQQQVLQYFPDTTTQWPSLECETLHNNFSQQASCYAKEIHLAWTSSKFRAQYSDHIMRWKKLHALLVSGDYSAYKAACESKSGSTNPDCLSPMPATLEEYMVNAHKNLEIEQLNIWFLSKFSTEFSLSEVALEKLQDSAVYYFQERTCDHHKMGWFHECTPETVNQYYPELLRRPTKGFIVQYSMPETQKKMYFKLVVQHDATMPSWFDIESTSDKTLLNQYHLEFYDVPLEGLEAVHLHEFSHITLKQAIEKIYKNHDVVKQYSDALEANEPYKPTYYVEHFIPFYDSYLDALNRQYVWFVIDTGLSIFTVATAGIGEAAQAGSIMLKSATQVAEKFAQKMLAGEAMSVAEHVALFEAVTVMRYASTSIGKAAFRLVDPGFEFSYHILKGVKNFTAYKIVGMRQLALRLTAKLFEEGAACATGAISRSRRSQENTTAELCGVLANQALHLEERSESLLRSSRRSSGYASRRGSQLLEEGAESTRSGSATSSGYASRRGSQYLADLDEQLKYEAMRTELKAMKMQAPELRELSYQSQFLDSHEVTKSLDLARVMDQSMIEVETMPLLTVKASKPVENLFEDIAHNKFVQMKGHFYQVQMVLPKTKNEFALVKSEQGKAMFFLRDNDYALQDFHQVAYNPETKAWDVMGNTYYDVMDKCEDLNNGFRLNPNSTSISLDEVQALYNSDEPFYNADFGAKQARRKTPPPKVEEVSEEVVSGDSFEDSLEGTESDIEASTDSDPETASSVEEDSDVTEEQIVIQSHRQPLSTVRRHHVLGQHIHISDDDLLARVANKETTVASKFGRVSDVAVFSDKAYEDELTAKILTYDAINQEYPLFKALLKAGEAQTTNVLTEAERQLLDAHGYGALKNGVNPIRRDLIFNQKVHLHVKHLNSGDITGYTVNADHEKTPTYGIHMVLEFVKDQNAWKLITAYTE